MSKFSHSEFWDKLWLVVGIVIAVLIVANSGWWYP